MSPRTRLATVALVVALSGTPSASTQAGESARIDVPATGASVIGTVEVRGRAVTADAVQRRQGFGRDGGRNVDERALVRHAVLRGAAQAGDVLEDDDGIVRDTPRLQIDRHGDECVSAQHEQTPVAEIHRRLPLRQRNVLAAVE